MKEVGTFFSINRTFMLWIFFTIQSIRLACCSNDPVNTDRVILYTYNNIAVKKKWRLTFKL